MDVLDDLRGVLRDVLQLGDEVKTFDDNTGLFGSLPELDSMAVASVMVALEERFDFVIEDDEIGAETFETMGSLRSFVEQKLDA